MSFPCDADQLQRAGSVMGPGSLAWVQVGQDLDHAGEENTDRQYNHPSLCIGPYLLHWDTGNVLTIGRTEYYKETS